jgi:hypothetical protein
MKLTVAATAVSALALAVAFGGGPASAQERTVSFELVAEGLLALLALVQPLGDERRFIIEQPGRIRILADDNFLLDEPFLTSRTRSCP